jgi:hypothetical protein
MRVIPIRPRPGIPWPFRPKDFGDFDKGPGDVQLTKYLPTVNLLETLKSKAANPET